MAGTWGLQIFLLCLTPALLPAVKINAKGREIIYLAKGDSVKLGCPYELEPEDHGSNGLDIEWTQLNADPTNLDNVILSYHGQQVIHPGHPYVQARGAAVPQDPRRFGLQQNVVMGGAGGHHPGALGDCCAGLQQRVHFALPDPSQSDASINLQNVQVSDTATYECKVKKTTVATRKVTVTVLERPSAPQCSIQGRVALGREVTLRCASHAGSAPLIYQWAKVADRPVGNWLPSTTTKGPNPGDLVIRNLSRDHEGVYQCSVANKVGSAQCVLEISFSEGANQVGIIVGAVLGSLLLLLLLVGLLVALVCCCRRKRDTEQSNQLRVDTAPPRRRGGSRNGSLRSVLGYVPHNLSFSQRRKYEPPKGEEDIEMISPARDADLSLNVDTSSAGSESRKGSCPSVVMTKARIHCPPAVSSSGHAKTGAPTASPQPPASATPGSGSCAPERDPAQAKRSHPAQYGGVPVMVSACSREGLVI